MKMMMLQSHPLLWTAIENKRMIRFVYHGKDRLTRISHRIV